VSNEHIESIAVVTGAHPRDRTYPHFRDDAEYRAALVEAGVRALRAANRTPAEIGALVGCALGSAVMSPDPLYGAHAGLGLDSCAPVMITRGELTNLLDALAIATSSGPAFDERPRLVIVGARMSQWSLRSQHPLALLVGDAVTAMVVGPRSGLRLRGMETKVLGAQGGAMRLASYVSAQGGAIEEEIVLDAAAGRILRDIGPTLPIEVTRRLLARFDVSPRDVALAPTQSIVGLAEHWREQLGIAEMFESITTLGNAGPASVGKNLLGAWQHARADHIVAIQLGWGLHFTAALFRRDGAFAPQGDAPTTPRRSISVRTKPVRPATTPATRPIP
jgi:3-oxoacyl-[acyl-carrier-protein] synthase III